MNQAVEVKTWEGNEHLSSAGLELAVGDKVIIKTERGEEEIGKVMALIETSTPLQEGKQIIRKATPEDNRRIVENQKLEKQAYDFCLERIWEMALPMKLIDVHYLFDGSKAIFFFSAESRVDFRSLVKDLSRKFHARIEMHQVKARNEPQLLGGIGPCGRGLCCATFIKDFQPVSLRMAREQNQPLNPSKLSGLCGRLKCCLSYEYQTYLELQKEMPRLGKRVFTLYGEGVVVGHQTLARKVEVEFGEGNRMVLAVEEIEEKGLFPFPRKFKGR